MKAAIKVRCVIEEEPYEVRFHFPVQAVSIGCQTHPLPYWLQNYEQIGREHSIDAATIRMYGGILRHIETLSKAKIPTVSKKAPTKKARKKAA